MSHLKGVEKTTGDPNLLSLLSHYTIVLFGCVGYKKRCEKERRVELSSVMLLQYKEAWSHCQRGNKWVKGIDGNRHVIQGKVGKSKICAKVLVASCYLSL